MAQRRNTADEEDLARVSADIEQWRRTRAKLSPMPASLWKAAVGLARRLGVNPVKEALGLNYNALRTRLEATNGGAVATSPARFVELNGAQVLGVATTGAVVEVADAHGARLTVRLDAGTPLDVARLVEAFRRPTA
jgi:hypothetical protein